MYLDSIVILVLFCLNILLSGYSIYADKQAFSLNKIYWIFNLIFLSAVPALQYLMGSFPWQKHFESITIIAANALILCCNIVYSIVRAKQLKHNTESNLEPSSVSPLIISSKSLRTFLLLYFATAIVQIALQGKGIFLRSETTLLDQISNSTIQLLVDKFLKGISLFGLLFSVHLWRSNQLKKKVFIAIIIAGIMGNFPTAVPRYWAATYYLSFLLTIFAQQWQKNKNLFANSVMAISFFAFPLLSVFRYSISKINSSFSTAKEVFEFSFLGGDFDAYTSLCSTINYVQEYGITWGRQLATVLLFFIPRSLWPSKSIGSGAIVNQLPHSDFTNFCSPFIAEGLINFGILGSVVFIGLLALFIARYDKHFWQNPKPSFNYFFYPIAIGMLFFMLRGDLLSSFAYTVGIYFSGRLLFAIIIAKGTKKQ